MNAPDTRRAFLKRAGLIAGVSSGVWLGAPLASAAVSAGPGFLSGRVLAVMDRGFLVETTQVVVPAGLKPYYNVAGEQEPPVVPGSWLVAAGSVDESGILTADTVWTDPTLLIGPIKTLAPDLVEFQDPALPVRIHLLKQSFVSPEPSAPLVQGAAPPSGPTAAVLAVWREGLRDLTAAAIYGL